MTQKGFTPEKVRELYNLLHFCRKDDELSVFLKWLEQNQPSPVVVGLSDEQVEDLASDLDSWNIGDTDGFIFHIKEWLKIQTFAQQSAFTPNWDDAPKNTHYARFQIEWLNKMYHQIGVSVLSQQERPKTMPVVEVGQVWRRKEAGSFSCEVVALSDEKVVIQLKERGDFAIVERLEFFAKLERVGDIE